MVNVDNLWILLLLLTANSTLVSLFMLIVVVIGRTIGLEPSPVLLLTTSTRAFMLFSALCIAVVWGWKSYVFVRVNACIVWNINQAT